MPRKKSALIYSSGQQTYFIVIQAMESNDGINSLNIVTINSGGLPRHEQRAENFMGSQISGAKDLACAAAVSHKLVQAT